ncbi:MAG: response regulator transcription factor [Pseudomonadales bacterium]|nr:response regulator transcription factor [Pseudomonadales bacterium]
MNKTLTAVIADDEPNLRSHLARSLASLAPAIRVVGEAANGREALQLIEAGQPDVAFLDIRMPGLTGLEVAARINGATRVVFVTAYDEYAIEAFENAAVDYLLKPLDEARLEKTIARLTLSPARESRDMAALIEQLGSQLSRQLSESQPAWLQWLRVGRGNQVSIVPVDEVMYFQADHKYTSVYTSEGEFIIRKTIRELEQTLDPTRFWRVHRSSLVNLAYIEVARKDFRGRYTLHLRGSAQTLKVSDTYSHLFRQM